jgi:hypothetical protein
MWLINSGGYINGATISRLEELPDGNGTTIYFLDGKKITSDRDTDSIAVDLGTLVPAQPGFEQLMLMPDDTVRREPIIAWRFLLAADSPIPMTASGQGYGAAVVYPCGQVLDRRTERFYPNTDVWLAFIRKAAEWQSKAKVAP